ncbi:hypothetical protein RFI_05595 [Reticulomyxa filosa]|uniref:Major facilitator superfamily (MFS) profile domain-containing protein n=1 Tax=Reticulomyxa filosa TaxID=46433 RepID=X6P0C4_RETFI|nr:hypothetical protein RFI_05595 [Reticulomyxa filosa]|eukprot:ETO31524.1 hypothetical protein RFI_05595 [Reticulomyxa filosa]
MLRRGRVIFKKRYSPLANSHLKSCSRTSLQFLSNVPAGQTNEKPEKKGFWDKLIEKHGNHKVYAPENYNRWRMVPYAVSTHLCLGACYAWSIFNEPLTREIGVVAPSAQDWVLSDVMGTFMGIIISQGLAMALLGKWVEKVGPRIAGVTGSLLYGGGMMLGALGVLQHSLPLMYCGYGALAGAGMGIAYLPPVATLIRWFPDRRGLATGMAICGFGGGAIFITSLKKKFLREYFQPPEYLGPIDKIITKVSPDGKILAFVEKTQEWKEALKVTTRDLVSIGASHLQDGHWLVIVYLSCVNTYKYYLVFFFFLKKKKTTGVAATMGTLGLGYLAVCLTGALIVKSPPPGWVPPSAKQSLTTTNTNATSMKTSAVSKLQPEDVHVDDVMKTPQFWLQWCTFLSTATVGMGLMSSAKDVLVSCFGTTTAAASAMAAGPAAFAASYVQALSLANLSGRFIWASGSEYIGRKNTFLLFCCVGGPLYATLPWIVTSAFEMESYAPLALFYGSTMLIISFFGGGYSTVPAYESDLFGTKYIGAIHGRMMTASALSGIVGPMVFAKLRHREEIKAIHDLASKCDKTIFENKFGVPTDKLQTLIDNKAVSIRKLLDVLPQDTIDPTPHLYDPAFQTMGGILILGAIANGMVRPVNSKWWMRNQPKYQTNELRK